MKVKLSGWRLAADAASAGLGFGVEHLRCTRRSAVLEIPAVNLASPQPTFGAMRADHVPDYRPQAITT